MFARRSDDSGERRGRQLAPARPAQPRQRGRTLHPAAPVHPPRSAATLGVPQGTSCLAPHKRTTAPGWGEAPGPAKLGVSWSPSEGRGKMLGGRHVSWEPWMARELRSFTSAEKPLRFALVCCCYPKRIGKTFRGVWGMFQLPVPWWHGPVWKVSYLSHFLTCVSIVHLPGASLSKPIRLYL